MADRRSIFTLSISSALVSRATQGFPNPQTVGGKFAFSDCWHRNCSNPKGAIEEASGQEANRLGPVTHLESDFEVDCSWPAWWSKRRFDRVPSLPYQTNSLQSLVEISPCFQGRNTRALDVIAFCMWIETMNLISLPPVSSSRTQSGDRTPIFAGKL